MTDQGMALFDAIVDAFDLNEAPVSVPRLVERGCEYVDRAPDNLSRVARLMPLLGGSDVERADKAAKMLRDAGYMEDGR